MDTPQVLNEREMKCCWHDTKENLASNCYWRWKVDSFSELEKLKGMVCYDMLKYDVMFNTSRYQEQLNALNLSLLEKRPEYQRR